MAEVSVINRIVGTCIPILTLNTIGMFLLSCSHSPTEPATRAIYPVYIAEKEGSHECWAYHPETRIMDTFALPCDISAGLYASPHGDYLICNSQSGSIGIVSSTSLEIEHELKLSSEGGIAFAPARSIMIVQGQDLNVVSLDDFSVHYSDTIRCWGGACDISGNLFYFASKDLEGSFIGIVKLDSCVQASRIQLSADSILQVAPSIDGERLFLLMIAEGGTLQFQSYDIGSGQSTYREYLWPPDGAMLVEPGGRYVFFNGAGDTPHDPFKDRYFRVFDVADNRVLKMISTVGVADGVEPQAMLPAYFAITPDGKWLIVGDYEGGSFLSFNINTMKVDKYLDLSPSILTSYTCQTKI